MTDRREYCYPFPRPAVTADVACFAEADGATHILLIRRRHDPFAGRWALPGGYVEQDEGLEAAALRELREETGLEGIAVEQLGAYGDPGRDPRGHTVTAAYLARLGSLVEATGADDADEASWFPIDGLPPLAFDHDRIIADAIRRYRREDR
jgi:8-oxo-dGTP diphosphatase